MKRILLFLVGLLTAVCVLPQIGSLDPSFARNGVVYADFGTSVNINSDVCQQILLKTDGSFFLVFEMGEQSIVTHRWADGSLDRAYGNNGYSRAVSMRRPSAALQADGKVVIGGYTMVNNDVNFVVARLNADGSLDATFSGDGLVDFDISSSYDYLNDIAVQPDGKILAVGRSYAPGGTYGSTARLNPDGSMDESFSNSGKQLASAAYIFNAVAVQADGKILAAGGNGQAQMVVVRYLANGVLDNSFSGDGQAAFSAGLQSAAKAIAIQADGKILLGGFEMQAGSNNFLLVRLLADGNPDPSFSSDGLQDTDFGADETIEALTIQANGKIVAAGSTTIGAHASFAVARYNADGSPDNSFSNDGKLVTAIGGDVDFAFDVALRGDGRLLVAGWSMFGNGVDYTVVQYLADGSVDPSFADNGKLVDYKPSGYTDYKATAVQKDGKIIAAGFANTGNDMQFAVARYNTNGSLDTTFGKKGMQTINFGVGISLAYDVAIQPDGGIVVAGAAGSGNDYYIALARLNYNGSPDSSFNGNGRLLLDKNHNGITTYQYARLVLQKDDKIVVATNTDASPLVGDILLVRVFSNGTIDPSFGTGGKVITDLGSTSDRAWDLLLQPDGKLFAVGSFDYYNQGKLAAVRYNSDGTLDPAFGNGGIVITGISGRREASFAGAIQPNGKILASGHLTTDSGNDLLIVRYNANGSLDSSFAQTGKLVFDMGATSEVAQAIAVQADGKIITAGYTNDGRTNVPALARFNPDGTFDTSFSSDGKIVGVPDRTMLFDIALSGSRLYAVGSAIEEGSNAGVIAAYLIGPGVTCPGSLSVAIPNAVSLDKGADPNTVYPGYSPASQITLAAKVSGGTTPYQYLWSNGAHSSTITVAPAANTNYTVTVTDKSGCVVTAAKQVFSIDVRCGNNDNKVSICQQAGGKANNICVAAAAVPAQLKNGSRLGACVQGTFTNRSQETATTAPNLLVWPNPSNTSFKLRLSNVPAGSYVLVVRDVLGRVIEQKKLSVDRQIEIGGNYKPGLYSVSLFAGTKSFTAYVVKE